MTEICDKVVILPFLVAADCVHNSSQYKKRIIYGENKNRTECFMRT